MRSTLTIALAATMYVAASPTAHAQGAAGMDGFLDQIFKTEDQGCTTQVKLKLSDAIKKGVEDEVIRRESAIKDPIALSAMSCLDNLMDVNLDFHIQVPNLNGIFNQAVSDLENQLCSMANEKLAELTAPLQEALNFDPFEALNIPGTSGGGSSSDIGLGSVTIGSGEAGGAPNVQFERREATDGSLTEETLDALYGTGRNE